MGEREGEGKKRQKYGEKSKNSVKLTGKKRLVEQEKNSGRQNATPIRSWKDTDKKRLFILPYSGNSQRTMSYRVMVKNSHGRWAYEFLSTEVCPQMKAQDQCDFHD